MLNFHVSVDGQQHVGELQLVHETLLCARSGLPGHEIYNRVRNANELCEYAMAPGTGCRVMGAGCRA